MIIAPHTGVRVVKADESDKDKKIARLEREVASLRKDMRAVREQLESSRAPHVVVLRTLTHEQAKDEIKAYFDSNPGKVVHYDELVRELGIDLPTVVAICAELVQEGEIG
jgi:orotidine-5'-phosphate decarboxylase